MSLYRLDGDAEIVMRGLASPHQQQDEPYEDGATAPADLLPDPATGWSSMEDSLTVVTSALQLIPGAEVANLCSPRSLLRGPHLQVVAGTSLALRALEDLQVDAEQGPSLLAAQTSEIITSPQLQHDGRWPGFAAEAAPLGTSSVLSVPLVVRSALVGVLSLYAADPHVFTERAVLAAGAFAAPAALVVRGAQANDHARRLAAHKTAAVADRRTSHSSRATSDSSW